MQATFSGLSRFQTQSAQATARANARMALMLAIGELQKTTGPDQRVTLTSSLQTDAEPPSSNWTGAVEASSAALTPDAKNAQIRWLVSGANPNPSRTLTPSIQLNRREALRLGGKIKTPSGKTAELLAPVVNIALADNSGRFAWWIGDEGAKAWVDLAKPKTSAPTDRDRLARSQSPLEGVFSKLGGTRSAFAPSPTGSIDKAAFFTMQTASLASANWTFAGEYSNDVTTEPNCENLWNHATPWQKPPRICRFFDVPPAEIAKADP